MITNIMPPSDNHHIDLRIENYVFSNQEIASVYDLADGSLGDWFGGILYSVGQQANEAVLDQLSSLSFTRYNISSFEH